MKAIQLNRDSLPKSGTVGIVHDDFARGGAGRTDAAGAALSSRGVRLSNLLTAGLGLWMCLAVCLPAHARKYRVEDPNEARSMVERGGRVLADYGTFQIVDLEDTAAVSANARVQAADRLDYILLKAGPLATRGATIVSRSKPETGFSGHRLHLVQFVGPIKPEWRQALETKGANIVSYLPEDAFLVYGDADAIGRLQSWASAEPTVQWQGAYLADFKVDRRVRSAIEARSLAALGTGTFAVQLVDDPESNATTLQLIDHWKLAPIRREYRVLNYHNLVVALPAEALAEIAAQPDVVSLLPWFEPRKKDERQDQILAGNLIGNVPSGAGYLSWLASKGFSQAQFFASGFVVDVSDSGIDNGTTAPGHFGLFPEADLSQNSRVAYSRLEGVPNNPGSTLAGCDGHGTLNAHIVAGYDDFPGFPHLDGSGFSYGLGVCPFVRVGASVVFDPDNFTSPDPATLQTHAFSDGARISNNSWGASAEGAYDSDAQTYDTLVRDVGAGSNQRQMTIVFVAGNDGPTSGSTTPGIDSPGTAKNVITVGASENVRSLSIANGGNDSAGNDGCGDPDTAASSANDVSGFSSQGPCADGRSKPDVVAPGTHITGGVPQLGAATTNGTGTALACFNASGVCALPGSGMTGNADNFFPLNQQFFTVSTGTSHAAPAVAGACALIRQYFINHNLAAPSPAMIKAYLMNSARYLTGAYANDTLWSKSQGMGGLDLGAAFDGVARILRDQLPSDKFIASGQQRTFSGFISDSSRPLRVTLAWTDAAGSTTAAKALINDLDLEVNVGGSTYLGNVFNGPNSTTGGTADSLNNVESVFLPAGGSTNFTVTITAANVVADALLSGSSSAQQDFALVIYNAVLTNVPPYVPTADSYGGLFSQGSGAQADSSGSVSLKTTTKSTFSGKLQLGAKHYGFSGRFDSFGAASTSIKQGKATPFALNLQMDTTDNGRIAGTLVGSNWVANLLAVRQVYGAKANPAPFAGDYTLIIPGTGNPANHASPQGDGYAAIRVATSAKAKISGVLADGTRFTGASTVAAGDQWPLYVPVYRAGGCLVGWLNFAQSQQTDLAGVVTWVKQPDFSAKTFPAGFNLQTNASGSVYHPPDKAGNPIVTFTSGSLVLNGGGLANTITNPFTIGKNSRVETGTNSWSMNFVLAQGLFKGTATDPSTGKRFPFSGAVLQKQDKGSGFFVTPTGDGRVTLGP